MNKKNLILIAVGVLMLVIGFICLASGPADNPVSLTVAPIILSIAYLVIIPLGILWSGKKYRGGRKPYNTCNSACGDRLANGRCHF